MPEINSLKEKKEGLFGEKKGLLDKRKEVIIKLRALRSEISDLKNQRNQFNQMVQENKKKRSEADTNLKQLSNDIQNLRQSQLTVSIQGKTSDIEKDFKDLEWKYQTQALTPSEDKRMSKKIQELRAHLEALKARDNARKGIRAKQQELFDLQKEQKIYHLNVLSNAERSEAKHQELLALYQRADGLKTEKEKYDEKLGPISDKISEIKDELKKEFDVIKADKKKEEAKLQAGQNKILEKKAKIVKAKIKNGEKLTTEDILVIQQADLDI